MCARRPTRPNLVGRERRTHHPPQSVARGNLAPPPASANQGQLCNLASPPLSAPSRPENPITLPSHPTALHSTLPDPLPVCRARRLICSSRCPQGSLVVLSFVSFVLRLTKTNSLVWSCQFKSVQFCPVSIPLGWIPVKVCHSKVLALSLCLYLLCPSPLSFPPLLPCVSLIAFPQLPSVCHILGTTSPRPSSTLPYSTPRCSTLLDHSPRNAQSRLYSTELNETNQPATGATREESHFGRPSKFSDRRRGRIALQIGTVSEASPHPPSPGYPITQAVATSNNTSS